MKQHLRMKVEPEVRKKKKYKKYKARWLLARNTFYLFMNTTRCKHLAA